ncbi:ABC transporter ATP-binding protein [Rhizocola hellebori]|uniref:ABC transporter ATP-binding protein n=1 Tax=Rhizocola hellebori TaxID=1392758 RepID=A0A8J3Q561_9ACTN|nr:ABC transporter ATP-binding protein [Rhizocola hellebori]GIH03503.1 ABC transporter ATP-binding protein [Rhizocola hellebori]
MSSHGEIHDDVVLAAAEVSLRLGATQALDQVSVAVRKGECVAVVGPSGCGKSTLLHVLAGLLRPDSGSVAMKGRRIDNSSDAERSRLRLRHFGFVFQFGDLVPELSLWENVALPLRLAGTGYQEARNAAYLALEGLDIADLGERRPGQVSGGQLQRAAIARATAHRPVVVFADEPTGALDSKAGALVLERLLDAAASYHAAVVLVTHDPAIAAAATRVVQMRDGGLVADGNAVVA